MAPVGAMRDRQCPVELPLGDGVTRHFRSPEDAFLLLDGIRSGSDPFDIVAEMERRDDAY